MSTQFFIGPKSDGKPLGNIFWGGTKNSKMFGFVPIDELSPDLTMIQPGNDGYGRAMLQYWKSTLEPETVITDIYGFKTPWSDFVAALEFGVIKISDSVVGNTCIWKER